MAKLTHPKGRTVEVPDETAEYYLSKGWVVDVVTAEEPETVVIPDGEPTDEWSHKQFDALATRDGIDFGGATTKADKLAAIVAARASD
jgi:hypothetical protein